MNFTFPSQFTDNSTGKSNKLRSLKAAKKIVALLICLAAFSGQSAELPAKHWNSFLLWSNFVLSAELKYLPESSLADEDYMYVEFDNHTGKTLDVSQAWLSLPGTRIDNQTKKSVSMGDMTGGVIFIGKLPPGKTRAVQHGVFEGGLANLGLPPHQGFTVELTPRVDVRLADGRTFSTPPTDQPFTFQFRYPNPVEIESMKSRFKALLAHPDNQFASGYQLLALSLVPEVADSVTSDELLSPLKSHSYVDGKSAIMAVAGRRFPNDPRLLAYCVDQLSRIDGDAFFSFPSTIWHNPVFIEPLVRRYEEYGNDSLELQQLRSAWITNPPVVARLSLALMQHHPLLSRPVAEWSHADLCDWPSAASDAGIIGNTNFLTWLTPALDDPRVVPDCLSQNDSRGRPLWYPRVCDCALEAILMIQTGDAWSAFKKGVLWRTKEEDYAAHDAVINHLKRQLIPGDERSAK